MGLNRYLLTYFFRAIAALLFALPVGAFGQLSVRIHLNQDGFYPHGPKVAILSGNTEERRFYVTTTNLRDTVFSGTLSKPVQSGYSSTITRIADFSRLTGLGSFVVCVPGVGHSYGFSIENNVNRKAGIAVLKGFYYQRASMPLVEKFAGKWHRSAGDPDTAVYIHPSAASPERPAGTVISTPGGWYDAGDYNKYIVNSGITMGTLLSAYEDFPGYYNRLETNIPAAGDGLPDILNEAIYNLRWMLTMQDPHDGGVYNKCTNATFDPMVMPGVSRVRRYVVQKGTAATLDFAAVTAQASRSLSRFKSELPGLADSCRTASEKAWKWALQHPDLIYDQEKMNHIYGPPITTGAYGDGHLDDEWFWAASELLATTGKKMYYDSLQRHLKDSVVLPTWSKVALLGYYSLLRNKKRIPAYCTPMLARMSRTIVNMADSFIRHGNDAFQTVMGQTKYDFSWGGNSVAANQGILLINAYFLTHEKKFVDGALSNLDYILGRNATGYCFVTGIGSKSTMNPHHRQSVSDGVTDPVPGLVAGGPNPGRQDHCHYDFTEPETAYADISCAYASNEVAINWNAPMVYLCNGIEALQRQVGYATQ